MGRIGGGAETRHACRAQGGSKGSQHHIAAILQQSIGPLRVGEDDRLRRMFRAQAIAIPSGGADRVAHALASARSYGTPALDDGHLSLALGRLSGVRRESHEEDQWPITYPAAPFLRGGGTSLVTVLAWDPLHSRVVAGAGREARPDLGEHVATAWAQDAVGADCDAPPWQPMLEEAVDAHCRLPTEVVGVQNQGLQGGSGGLKEQVGEAVLLRTGYGALCLRQRTGHEEVRARQEEITPAYIYN